MLSTRGQIRIKGVKPLDLNPPPTKRTDHLPNQAEKSCAYDNSSLSAFEFERVFERVFVALTLPMPHSKIRAP